MQELKALHLYCGAGGLSFAGGKHSPSQFCKQASSPDGKQQAANMGDVEIRSRWAVDIAEAMCHSYEVNHPEAKV